MGLIFLPNTFSCFECIVIGNNGNIVSKAVLFRAGARLLIVSCSEIDVVDGLTLTTMDALIHHPCGFNQGDQAK